MRMRHPTLAALAMIVVPFAAGSLYFRAAAPPERPGVYLLTLHQELIALEPVREPAGVRAVFPTDLDVVSCFFVFTRTPEESARVRQQTRAFIAVARQDQPSKFVLQPLDVSFLEGSDRLVRVESQGWNPRRLHERLVQATTSAGAAPGAEVYFALQIAGGTAQDGWYLVRVGPPFSG